jgi:predicted metal-binding membrane protein
MFDRRSYVRLHNGMLLVSLLAWVLLLNGAGNSCNCGTGSTGFACRMMSGTDQAMAMAKGWGLMLGAMMTPMLVTPINFIWLNSFARTRILLVALFTAGYSVLWMLAGGVLMAAQRAVEQAMPGSYGPVLVAAMVAFAWQASPYKQMCLNRCHGYLPIPAFGGAAIRDAVRMGLRHGWWCIGSCWALMAFPLLLPTGHNLAMMGSGLLMFCERLDPAAVPEWRLRGFRTALQWLTWRMRSLSAPMAVPWRS